MGDDGWPITTATAANVQFSRCSYAEWVRDHSNYLGFGLRQFFLSSTTTKPTNIGCVTFTFTACHSPSLKSVFPSSTFRKLQYVLCSIPCRHDPPSSGNKCTQRIRRLCIIANSESYERARCGCHGEVQVATAKWKRNDCFNRYAFPEQRELWTTLSACEASH